MLLLQTQKVPYQDAAEKVLNITPEGATGYGLALLAVIVLAFIMWKQRAQAEKRAEVAEAKNDQLAAKVLEFGMSLSRQMAAVQQRLEDTRGVTPLAGDIKRITEDTNRKVNELISEVKSYK